MPLHPLEREYIERAAVKMTYIVEKLAEADQDFATRADFGEYARTIYIGLDKCVGFQKVEPAGPCPEFGRADETMKVPKVLPSVAEPAPQRNLAGHEHRDGEVHLATDKQVAGIFRWTERDPRYDAMLKAYLDQRDLLEPGQLTIAEASDLMDEFAAKAGLKQGQGAKR